MELQNSRDVGISRTLKELEVKILKAERNTWHLYHHLETFFKEKRQAMDEGLVFINKSDRDVVELSRLSNPQFWVARMVLDWLEWIELNEQTEDEHVDLIEKMELEMEMSGERAGRKRKEKDVPFFAAKYATLGEIDGHLKEFYVSQFDPDAEHREHKKIHPDDKSNEEILFRWIWKKVLPFPLFFLSSFI